MALAIGMKVVINPKSKFYSEGKWQLPPGIIGEIVDYQQNYVFKWSVSWRSLAGNNYENDYDERDL